MILDPSKDPGEGRERPGPDSGGQGTASSLLLLPVLQVDPTGKGLFREGSKLDVHSLKYQILNVNNTNLTHFQGEEIRLIVTFSFANTFLS